MPTSGERAGPALFDGGARFAACVAHELRSPLAAQRALLELTLGDPDADLACWREIGAELLGACHQQERLLEAFLALARSQSRTQRREPVELARLAAETLDAHPLDGLERVLTLEPTWTSGDPELLARLTANLVSNAVRHNLAGGRIEVATRARSGHAHLTITNSGPLVPATELERLLQPFQQLNPRPPNDGLGLTIVHAIAEVHAAAVSVESPPAGGLAIDVAFPALD